MLIVAQNSLYSQITDNNNFLLINSDFIPNNEAMCLTDDFYLDYFKNEYMSLSNRRYQTKKNMDYELNRLQMDTLRVPVVFHNLYKIIDGNPFGSYCDFGMSDEEIGSKNDQNICEERINASLKVLNAQYAPISIKFYLDTNYPPILDAHDIGYDGFYLNPNLEESITSEKIKEHYNKPNVLNIYTHECLHSKTENCKADKAGFATYPWSLQSNYPGIFIRHKSLPGSSQEYSGYKNESHVAKNSQVGVLAHEIGHFFSLLHINGIWFLDKGNIQRELVSGENCNKYGDMICDTPGSPGYVPTTSSTDSSWYFDKINRKCIYHGYGGHFDSATQVLKIGGYNKSFFLSASYPNFNYCQEWGITDFYGIKQNCTLFTNYDSDGDFFGTKNLSANCLKDKQDNFASECNLDAYPHLPIGNNFMQSGSVTLNTCSPRSILHDDYMKNDDGFTPEQFANIRRSLELDYTRCSNVNACNYNKSIRKSVTEEMLLLSGESSCLFPCEKSESDEYYIDHHPGCLITDPAYKDDYPEDVCKENKLTSKNNTQFSKYKINKVFPNPFNHRTSVSFTVTDKTNIKILIYDINGRLVFTLVNEYKLPGNYNVLWNATNFSSGIYLLKMQAFNNTQLKKILLIK